MVANIPSVAENPKKLLNKQQNKQSIVANPVQTDSEDTLDIRKELRSAKRQNGLIEIITDKIKGAIGYGHSIKKFETRIKNGEDEQKISQDIQKYREQQENTAHAVIDVGVGLYAAHLFTKKMDWLRHLAAKHLTLGAAGDIAEMSGFTKKLADLGKNKYAPIGLGVLCATVASTFIKPILHSINRIGTDQYKPDINKNMKNREKNAAREEASTQRKKANLRNWASGAITGLSTGVLSLGGIIGAPLYIIINSLNRYFVASTQPKEKSLNGYVTNLTESPVSQIGAAAAVAIPAYKKADFSAVLNKNLQEAVKKLQNVTLKNPPLSKTTANDDLYKLLNDNYISKTSGDTVQEQISNLSQENIIALKFKQIMANDDELSKALKNDCPYTLSQIAEDGSVDFTKATQRITETFGPDKYSIKARMGAGTIAETYLVTEKSSGKEFVIKMLKNGISADKIKQDGTKIEALIDTMEGKTDAQKEYLKRNLKNIVDGIEKEVDFKNEMQAAEELSKATQKAKLVRPVEVKGSCYVMEKADGICLQELFKYAAAKNIVKNSGDDSNPLRLFKGLMSGELGIDSMDSSWASKYVNDFETKYGKNVDCTLTADEVSKIYKKYVEIYVEQFTKIGADGKTIHGDLHPGNIFIDLNAFRNGDDKFITLIDTGNVIRQSKDSALRLLNMQDYIKNGDVEGITKYVLTDAKLPEGMTEADATKLMSDKLKDIFYGNKYFVEGGMRSEELFKITDSIMQENGIIPAEINASLQKAQKSAQQSMDGFIDQYQRLSQDGIFGGNIGETLKRGAMSWARIHALKQSLGRSVKEQEALNLKALPKSVRKQFKQTASCPKKNSLEYLMYDLKQAKASAVKPEA